MPIPVSSVVPSLDDLKQHLNITSDTHDDELQLMLDAAVEVVEGHVGPLDGTQVTETHYGVTPRLPLILRRSPALSVVSVQDSAGNAYDADDYDLDIESGLLRLDGVAGAFTYWSGDVTVTYTAGRASLPARVHMAILIVAARLWETQRGNAPSALPFTEDGLTADPGGLPLLPPRARELLELPTNSSGAL